MMISLHLPKTAGKSFEAALEARFAASLLEDYGSFPMNTPEYERTRAALEASLRNVEDDFPGVECIHGHFLPVKYLLLAIRRWHRQGVLALKVAIVDMGGRSGQLSEMLQRQSESDVRVLGIFEDGLGIARAPSARFCLSAEMRNLYGQFLWGFPVENFDFIGVTEFYEEDLAYFAKRYLGVAVEPLRLNVGDAQGGPYPIDSTLRTQIEAFHERDMALYQTALEKRRARHSV